MIASGKVAPRLHLSPRKKAGPLIHISQELIFTPRKEKSLY
jgi:hypothetical protein